jgi:hypothetical protein
LESPRSHQRIASGAVCAGSMTLEIHVNFDVVKFVGSADLADVGPVGTIDKAQGQLVLVGSLVGFESCFHCVMCVWVSLTTQSFHISHPTSNEKKKIFLFIFGQWEKKPA